MPSQFANVSDVAPRVGDRPLTATTVPSLQQVEEWIIEAEAELLGTLAAVGISTSYSEGTRGFSILRHWVLNYVAGMFRVSHAASGGDGSNTDGQWLVEEWRNRLREIAENADKFAAMLGAAAAGATTGLSSHVTDPVLGLEESEYGPTFKRGVTENF